MLFFALPLPPLLALPLDFFGALPPLLALPLAFFGSSILGGALGVHVLHDFAHMLATVPPDVCTWHPQFDT
jgi:hypothetical protein